MESAMVTPERNSKKRKRSKATREKQVGAVGAGLQVAVPRKFPHGYSDRFTVKLTFADAVRLDVTNTTSNNYIWKMNDLFDPDHTGTGHQPMMRDLWASQYNYYSVISCDYHVEIFNGSTATHTYTAVSTNPQRLGSVSAVFIKSTNTTDITALASPFPACETKNAIVKIIHPEKAKVFKGTLSHSDYRVEAKDQDSDQTWTAVGSSPTVKKYFGINVGMLNYTVPVGASPATLGAGLTVFYKFDYIVQFAEVNATYRQVAS